jgi:hypothetical protein
MIRATWKLTHTNNSYTVSIKTGKWNEVAHWIKTGWKKSKYAPASTDVRNVHKKANAHS